MTAISDRSSTSAQSLCPSLEGIKDNLSKPENWTYLLPTIGVIAIGILFAPHFAIGLAAGAALGTVNLISVVGLQSAGIIKPEEKESEYSRLNREYPLAGTVFAPVIEELLFRGGLQPWLTRSIVWIIPTAAAVFLGTPFSIATTVSIVATAAIFGLIHLSNPHPNAHFQVVYATMSGIVLGVIGAQFGLAAAIAAHIANNTLVTIVGSLTRKQQPPPETSTTRIP